MSDFETHDTGTMHRLTEVGVALTEACKLLELARCPNAHCVDGVIQEGFPDDYEVFQCQWCDERKKLVDEHG